MNRKTTAAVFSAAVSILSLVFHGAKAWSAPADAPPVGQPAAAATQIPVRQVVLFSSGVGYFEHFGTVTGTGDTELRFKTQQINDILKSLVLEDLDKGRVTAITYPSQDPIAKTLRSFQVDITTNPSLAELLNQLRGAKVKLAVAGSELEGTIIGLEKKQKSAGTDRPPINVWVINLLNGAELKAIELDAVSRVDLQDPELRDELAKALSALAQARDQDKKPVRIHFTGDGERRVRIGYVVETPVWKTSYRLILGGPPVPSDKPDAAQAAGKPASGKIQGWAIVENQTDNDWNDVQLSLVSGRPISFIQDLYQPLYIPRPIVVPELYASLRPQTYQDGLRRKAPAEAFAAEAAAAVPMAPPPMAMAGQQMQERAKQARGEMDADKAMDAAASVASVASAAKVGELFQYTVGNVSLTRQRSAMIPIITDDIDVERLSIYNAGVLPRNPLNGARVHNTCGKHLLAGPITVLDAGTYAGDASIDNVPPGQERLIGYGVDLQVLVDSTTSKQDDIVETGKIVKGVMTLSRKHIYSQDYVSENKSEHEKTLIIEHPLRQGWTLADTIKPIETTDTLYRFKGNLGAGKTTKLTVKQQLVDFEEIAILSSDVSQLEIYRQAGGIPQKVKDVLSKAIELKNAQTDTQRQIDEHQQQIGEITKEQIRIRDNMKTVAQSTDYYNRMLKKLDEQETRIEKLQGEVQGLQKQLDEQRAALERYLANINL